jgi:hypothetical protein
MVKNCGLPLLAQDQLELLGALLLNPQQYHYQRQQLQQPGWTLVLFGTSQQASGVVLQPLNGEKHGYH